MKNGKLKYILLPVVIVIWGSIIYKVIAPNSNEIETVETDYNVTTFNLQPFEKYTIENIYPDPFLKNVNYKETQELSAKETPIKQEKEESKPEIIEKPFPKVNYSGIIKNNTSEEKVALLSIEGNDRVMREGEFYRELELIKIYRDSIQLKFVKQVKIIKR